MGWIEYESFRFLGAATLVALEVTDKAITVYDAIRLSSALATGDVEEAQQIAQELAVSAGFEYTVVFRVRTH